MLSRVGSVLHPHAVEVTTDASGCLWLIVGTDSGFEGLSAFYWSRISYWLTPAE